jgi:hypothetical protein
VEVTGIRKPASFYLSLAYLAPVKYIEKEIVEINYLMLPM